MSYNICIWILYTLILVKKKRVITYHHGFIVSPTAPQETVCFSYPSRYVTSWFQHSAALCVNFKSSSTSRCHSLLELAISAQAWPNGTPSQKKNYSNVQMFNSHVSAHCELTNFSKPPSLPERKPIGNLLLEHIVVGTAAFRDQTTAKAGRKLCHPPWKHPVLTEDCSERRCHWKKWRLTSCFQMVSNVWLYTFLDFYFSFSKRCIKTCHSSHMAAERTLPSSGELNHSRTSSSSGPNASTKWGAGKPQPESSKLYLADFSCSTYHMHMILMYIDHQYMSSLPDCPFSEALFRSGFHFSIWSCAGVLERSNFCA